jgi:electron transfer flavoprotein alpha subunit
MKEIFVLAEHRRGELRDITFEILAKGNELAQKIDASLTAVLLGYQTTSFADTLKDYANSVLFVDDERVKDFNSEVYQKILSHYIKERQPILTLIGHTAFGIDLASSLAAELNVPLTTDCIGLDFEDSKLFAERQMYGGKVNARVELHEALSSMVTIRQAAFKATEAKLKGEIVKVESPLTEEIAYRKFIEYVEAAVGEVDITQADIIVAVGRGIKERENLPIAEELANSIGGVLACSRPIVDAGWLPKDRQVGSSGKTVKPKLYIAAGISGAFQHITGMKGADTIVAINKDPNAPIFNEADYGIVGDLFKVVPALKAKIVELKS